MFKTVIKIIFTNGEAGAKKERSNNMILYGLEKVEHNEHPFVNLHTFTWIAYTYFCHAFHNCTYIICTDVHEKIIVFTTL